MTGNLSNTGRPAGFWLRFTAALIDLAVLAVPFAVFVSFLSVGMRLSNDFLDLRPGMPPSEVLMRFGPRFLYISLGFFIVLSWAYLPDSKVHHGGQRWGSACLACLSRTPVVAALPLRGPPVASLADDSWRMSLLSAFTIF